MTGARPRLLIVGARGFIGAHVAREAAAAYEVFRGDCLPPEVPDDVVIDIADEASVRSAFERVAPDAVLLLAAISDIDRCQAEPQLAEAINVRGVENVSCACARAKAVLLYTSSAAVFDGTKHGYTEEDAPTPVSIYGETKARAEAAITALTPSAIIVRLALVLGSAGRTGTNSLVDNLAAKWKAGHRVALPTYEYRNPIDAPTLARFMVELLGREDVRGIYHIGAKDSISRFELGLKLAKKMGYAPDAVQPQTEPMPGRAPRGSDHFLLTDKIRAVCSTAVPDCNEVIERCIDAAA